MKTNRTNNTTQETKKMSNMDPTKNRDEIRCPQKVKCSWTCYANVSCSLGVIHHLL